MPEGVEIGQDGYFVRLAESSAGLEFEYSVLTGVERFHRETPAAFEYKARLCRRDESTGLTCGNWSRSLVVDVPSGLQQFAPVTEAGGSLLEGGPDEIASGVYSSTLTSFNAWHFNWANRLRFPQLADTFPEEHFDLAIRWQTYEYSAALSRTVPIWLWAQLEVHDGSGSVWSGPLYYRIMSNGQLINQNVGQIEVTPAAGSAAPDARVMGVRWRTDRSTMYGGGQTPNTWVNDTLHYSAAAGAPGTNRLPHDSFSGDWRDDPTQPPDQNV